MRYLLDTNIINITRASPFDTRRRKYRLSTAVIAGLDPAIGYPPQFSNDAVPVSNHPMEMTGSSRSSPVMTPLDRCVRYVNSKGG